MRRRNSIGAFILFTITTLVLLSSCNAEKKVIRYKGIYEEKPAVILVMNTIDKCKMKDESNVKTKKKNTLYNQEVKQANLYFHQGIYRPLSDVGYYVIQNFSGNKILEAENATNSEKQQKDSLFRFYEKYTIDAALFTTIFSWKENDDNWAVYLQYQLKSTRTDSIIFQIWVKGKADVTTFSGGSVNVNVQAKSLASRLQVTKEIAQRILIFNQVNTYVLSNLPVGRLAKDFDKDQNKSANADCIEYAIDELGSLTIQKIPLEKFEQECFIF